MFSPPRSRAHNLWKDPENDDSSSSLRDSPGTRKNLISVLLMFPHQRGSFPSIGNSGRKQMGAFPGEGLRVLPARWDGSKQTPKCQNIPPVLPFALPAGTPRARSAPAAPAVPWDRPGVQESPGTAILPPSQVGTWDELSHLCSAQGEKHLQFSLDSFSTSKFSTCQQHRVSPFTNPRQLESTKNTFCLFLKKKNHNSKTPCGSRAHPCATGLQSPVWSS